MMAYSKQNKSSIVNLLTPNNSNPRFVPPILRDVGKLAAGVAAVSTNTGSATGNPRNKCALQPGHSLMDWIRLGASGKDLTGVGAQAGHLAVTPSELAKHNKLSDAWLAIRGKVYNVTAYLPFHPGGPEELMRGIGKDATILFDEVHPWVNYESILQKCVVGRLTPLSPAINPEELFNSTSNQPSLKYKETIEVTPPKVEPMTSNNGPSRDDPPEKDSSLLPKFDWIQKTNEITIVFYTTPLANPLIEVKKNEHTIHVNLCYSNRTFSNELVLFKETQWPCELKVNYETGKIELVFRKLEGEVWNNYGVLKQISKLPGTFSANNKIDYNVVNKIQIASNIFLLELERADGIIMTVPIANHVRVFCDSKDGDTSRSYTPVPSCLVNQLGFSKRTSENICLMVKRYHNGNMSKYVCDAIKGDAIQLSKPLSSCLALSDLGKKEIFLLIAAGTGITPMLSLMVFLLERRIRRCQSIHLIFCNRKEKHIPFRDKFETLSKRDSRFTIEHILSEPDEEYKGKTGHINREFIEHAMKQLLSNANYPRHDLNVFVCGPVAFNEVCTKLLAELSIAKEQIYIFQG